MTWTFYYDVVCPYAYLAATRVNALAERTGTTVRWRPILLGGVLKAVGAPNVPADSKAPARLRIDDADLRRRAAALGVTLRFPPDHPRRTVNAMRLLLAAPEVDRPAMSLALYRAYWEDNHDLSDSSVLAELARAHGVHPEVIHDPAVRQGLFDATAEAVDDGVFGVPSFVVDGELFWGVDRLCLVEDALGGQRPPRLPAVESGKTVTFFHDFSSPFSYLASTQVQGAAERAGATVEWVPILLGALFKEIGTPLVPIQAMNPTRQAYQGKDLNDWAAWWGVPFQFNTHFPLRTVTALRMALQEPSLTPALYEAAWAEDRDIADDAVLKDIADQAGFDGGALLEGCADLAVKDQLRENTARAARVGACGVPTFQVDDTLYWGQDRLEQVETALRGTTEVRT